MPDRLPLQSDGLKNINPSYLQMAQSLAKIAADMATGGFAPPALASARRAICQGCEFYVLSNGKCSLCGCVIDAKAKVAKAKCPAVPTKWPESMKDLETLK